MSKLPVAPTEKLKKKWETKHLSVWDISAKANVAMTLVESVQDVIDHWDCARYGIDSLTFSEDPKAITAALKKLGYYPRTNVRLTLEAGRCSLAPVAGPHKPQDGYYYFEHYTKRKKYHVEGPSA
jgi:hypothetical protein